MDLKQLLLSCANDARNEEDALIIMQAVRRIADLEAKMVHCPDCGGDYAASGIEVGCNCKLLARIAELEARLAIAQGRERTYREILLSLKNMFDLHGRYESSSEHIEYILTELPAPPKGDADDPQDEMVIIDRIGDTASYTSEVIHA